MARSIPNGPGRRPGRLMYARNILFYWAFEAYPSPRGDGLTCILGEHGGIAPTRGSQLNGLSPIFLKK